MARPEPIVDYYGTAITVVGEIGCSVGFMVDLEREKDGRGVRRVAECEVTARYRETLGTVARFEDKAKAEGFDSCEAFVEAWTKINGSFDPREVVDVVIFKLVGGPHGNGPCNCAECLPEATCA